ncbi:MAG: hypothetical protein COA97_10170 [Flavobacteriales bacterium]|nr:MAG: hypothetical protein COA97_10170 [Flavobacteriales bacterium]
MNLESIISITGKPGLFKVLSQIKNGLIVESILDGKRMPVHATDKVSALSDISIYTQDSDIPLADIYDKIHKKTGGKAAVDHKSKPEELRSYIKDIVEDYDQDRVYNSDLKKLFQWFNLLAEKGLLKPDEKEAKDGDDKKVVKPKAKAPVKKRIAKPQNIKTSSAKGGGQTSMPSKKGG